MPDTTSEKMIKKACKAKKGAPKAKYLDPIIAATHGTDGAVQDICSALVPRLREPNPDIVFKALLILHTIIRSGGTDNVLTYLAQADVLRLKSVGTGSFWEGAPSLSPSLRSPIDGGHSPFFRPPSPLPPSAPSSNPAKPKPLPTPAELAGYSHAPTLTHYAHYLHARIKSYHELNHDIVRVQAETNRASGYRTGEEMRSERARKLRALSVEKGLLKETKSVQRVIDALIKCEFYKDDLEDECIVQAFRMSVKDLLVLFQAGNEGVINLLEHYFEMSLKDATEALSLYKGFCAQTKKVVEYLKFARELNAIIDVPVPNLKHAPVSLVTALEDYIKDPNFEQNRIEYKANKDIADGKTPKPTATASKPAAIDASSAAPASTLASPAASSSTAPAPKGPSNELLDFFSSIEENQPTMFNPQTSSPTTTHFEQQAAFNPFTAMQQQQQMGMGMSHGQQLFAQPTGFPQPPQMQMPQMTGFQGAGPQMHMLQPQPTGSNPFRQSMLMPHQTGLNPFMMNGGGGLQPQQTGFLQPQQQQQQSFLQPQATGTNPFSHQPSNAFSFSSPQRASTLPSPTTSSFSQAPIAPLTAQVTGSKNPFAPAGYQLPSSTPAPEKKGPSLNELSFSGFRSGLGSVGEEQEFLSNPSSIGAQNGNTMSNMASSFARPASAGPTSTPSVSSLNTGFSSLSFQPTGSTQASSLSPIQPQSTGFPGSSVQPFKPSSNFGSTLVSSMPASPSAASGSTPSFLQSQATGTPNPFRQSTLPSSFTNFPSSLSAQPTGLPATSSSSTSLLNSQPTGMPASFQTSQPTGFLSSQATGVQGVKPFQPTSSFGASLFSSNSASPGGGGIQQTAGFGQSLFASQQQQPNHQQQPQQNGSNLYGQQGSLI